MRALGCDVSYGRTSETALVLWEGTPIEGSEDILARVLDVVVAEIDSQPKVVDFITDYVHRFKPDYVSVDAIGFGRGVFQYLELAPFRDRLVAFVANESAQRDHETEEEQHLHQKMYANLKTRVLMEMRRNAFKGLVRLRDHPRLLEELAQYELKKIGGRWKTEDPKKSPDVGDAAVCGYAALTVLQPNFWMGA